MSTLSFNISDCGGLKIEIFGTRATLRHSGALWLEGHRTLVVADLHFEKGSSYAARFGQMLPPYDTRETLDRLERELAALSPATLVFLGDSFHDGAGEERLPPEDRTRIAALALGRELVWAVGNHDEDGPRTLPGAVVDEAVIAGLTFRHEPLHGDQPGEVAGHLHPAARVTSGRASVRRRCFVTDGARLVLPAFGAFTGGLNILDAAFAPLFGTPPLAAALGRGRVHAVGWKSLRPD
ncbi:ligase-associated DNA damage response endonuclease PdeM [Caulobacter sp. DWR2-3-1b2]|uniref:ligase-associated DNA damage response endonuclease PdeM n=1 Tax=unclassified Caulobacter TaxID=2648921 RepID=UPI0019AEFE2E|nr:ligase-associated DNA damage response endonuclease PdeM [Caulobacter sp.]